MQTGGYGNLTESNTVMHTRLAWAFALALLLLAAVTVAAVLVRPPTAA
ncbi:MAG TPA: hypothetical protein VIJ96_16040 [Acidothermaceae bacterium]